MAFIANTAASNILTVSEVNRYIKELISTDPVLQKIWIKGEISNYKYHYSGHIYFTLKDEKGILKCVMFKGQAAGLRFAPDNGIKVVARGSVSVFERDGQYQLYVEEMQPDGLGSLYLAFEQLKKKLQLEGLFDQSRKRKLPALPSRIGVVTSRTGAVVKDILNILDRRFGNIHVVIFPVAVQGESASAQVSAAISKLNELKCVDVIIIARGGGSLEELWAFNEEIVARSIFASEIPVISAVGHETDFTIADFVADMRAPTPSAAAEIVIPEKRLLHEGIRNFRIRLEKVMQQKLKLFAARLDKYMNSTSFKQPFNRIYQERMNLDIKQKSLLNAICANLQKAGSTFASLVGKLDALSPLNVLSRGYCTAKSRQTGKIISTIKEVKKGDIIDLDIKDGSLECTVGSVNARLEGIVDE